MKALVSIILLFIVTEVHAQELRLGMTKSEMMRLIAEHPHWTLTDGVILAISPIDSPNVIHNEDHGTFKIRGYEMYGLKGTLKYRLNLGDTVNKLSWRSDYLTFGKDRHKAARAYWEMLSRFAGEFGPAATSQDPETLIDLSTWNIGEGELRLIYDSRFPHIFAAWSAKKE